MVSACGLLQYTFHVVANDTGELLPLPSFLNMTGDGSDLDPYVLRVVTDDSLNQGNYTFAVVVSLVELPNIFARFDVLELSVLEAPDLLDELWS